MVYEDIEHNKRNTFFLIFFFILIITGLGYVLGELYGDPYIWVIAAFVFAIAYSFTTYYYSDKIVLAITGAKPANQYKHRQLIISAEGLALAAGLPKPRVYVMQGDAINAFATGRNPKNAVIAVTEGALKKLDKFELEGVIAHELSHIKNFDILVGTVAAVLVGVVAMLSDYITRSLFWGRGRRSSGGRGGAVIIIIAVLAAIIAPIAAALIRFAVSRQREYLADAQAVLLTRYPKGLIGALAKIKQDAAVENPVSSGMAHMYFNVSNSAAAKQILATHPPIDARIQRLSRM
ncbi:MAG TPA: zinc metalloprotease HtpX [bacterium]|nr:zinc metalloprotease HtpX [bacterium]